ncbi:MAG: protein-L-isoaspartate O-methyltransferase, partial [Massilia sp.]|nr:protein-L-isoaspartate O-methyltransferase [Massilia sp.]
MNDTSERKTFPLPLSSVTGAGVRKPGTPAPVATPQTATRNAAHAIGGAPLPKAAQPGPKLPGYAMPAAPSAPAAQRSDLMATEAIRRAMVARVAGQGVRDHVVLAALEAVP